MSVEGFIKSHLFSVMRICASFCCAKAMVVWITSRLRYVRGIDPSINCKLENNKKERKQWGKDPFWIECSLQFLWVLSPLCYFCYSLSNFEYHNLFWRIPGVSWNMSWVSPIVFTPKMSSRVVLTLWLTADTFFPINEFISVLLPELGAPQSPISRIFVLLHLYEHHTPLYYVYISI